MIDTHAHLNLKQFTDVKKVVDNATRLGVTKIIVPATNLQNAQTAINLAKHYPPIYATAGIHPEDTSNLKATNNCKKQILELTHYPKVVAIGECGLDYFWEKDEKQRTAQQKLFLLHLEIAQSTKLPLIIHSRSAYKKANRAQNDIMRIISRFLIQNPKTRLTGVFHCFSGQDEFLQKVLKLGFYIGFTGNITYNKNLTNLVAKTPIEKILTETDSPYLTPKPLPKLERNEPKNVTIVAKCIAKIKNLSIKKVEKLTTKNAKSLFNF